MREGRFGFESFGSPEENAERERKERWNKLWREFEMASDQASRLEALENIAAQAALEARDGFSSEIALKYVEKVRIKRTAQDLELHRDDDTYQPLKALGIFVVHHRRMEHDIADPDGAFDLKRGDEVLDLHLPPVPPEQRKKLRTLAEESLGKIAEYVVRHKLAPKYVTGITYAALARLAPKFGFEVKDIPLPDELSEPVRRVYGQSERGEKGEPIGDIALVYQTLEKFMSRWKPGREETAKEADFDNLEALNEAIVSGDAETLEKLGRYLHDKGFSEKKIDASIAAGRLRHALHEQQEREAEMRKKNGPPPSEDELSMGTFKEWIEPQVREALGVVRAKGYDTFQSGFDLFDTQSIFLRQPQFADIDPEIRAELEAMDVKVQDKTLHFNTDADINVDSLKQKWDAIASLLPDLGHPVPPTETGAARSFRKKYGGT